jgi:hypothetical protein
MLIKICNKCKIGKELSKDNFYIRSNTGKYRAECIDCCKLRDKIIYLSKSEKLKKYQKEYNLKNQEKVKNRKKEYYEKNKEIIDLKSKERRLKNPDYQKNNYLKNREERLAYAKNHRSSDEFKKARNEKRKKLRKENIFFKLKENIRKSIYKAFNRQKLKKSESSFKNLPYTVLQLKEHLEKQFEPWMNWDNYGVYKIGGEKKWNIDHIIPQSKLVFTSYNDDNFKKCWSLENLRPLEATENFSKKDKTI